MCFGCSKEPSHGDSSFEYPQHMFWLRNKKNNYQLHTLIWGPVLLNISIHHECEGGIEKAILRITDWHHEACRVMTFNDHEGQEKVEKTSRKS